MTPTKAMVVAARRAEFDYYQKGAARFVGTPDEVIKAMFDAALKLVEVVDPTPPSDRLIQRIITASKPAKALICSRTACA